MAFDIGPKIGIDGENQFKNALKAINGQIASLTSELNEVATSLTDYSSDQERAAAKSEVLSRQSDALKQKISILTDEYDRARSRLSDLDGALQRATTEFGENSKEATNAQNAYNKQAIEVNKLSKQLNDAQVQMNKLGVETEEATEKASLFKTLVSSGIVTNFVIDGIRQLASAMVDFTKSGIRAASDLQEVQNVVDVTFGEGSAIIDDFAKSAATSFGLSEKNAKQFTGTMGAMLNSMGLTDEAVLDMSTSLTGLAGDMASFYNLDPEEAFSKLRSGLSGETEPLKQLGINMSVANLEAYALSKGINKTYKSMTQAEQATLRYQYIMEATASAQGDFERTSEGFANQQRILQLNMENLSATVGGLVLPAVTDLLTGLNDVVSFLANAGTLAKEGGIQAIFDAMREGIANNLPHIVQGGIETVAKFIEGIISNLPNIVSMGVTTIGSLVQGIASSLPQVVNSAAEAIVNFLDTMDSEQENIFAMGKTTLNSVIDGILKTIPVLVGNLPKVISAITGYIIQSLPQIVGNGVEIIMSLIGGIVEAIPNLVASLPQVITAIVEGIRSLMSDIKSVGGEIIAGIWNGISDKWAWLKEQISGLGGKMINALKDVFKIKSPSRVMRDEVGKMLVAGIADGLNASSSALTSAIQSVNRRITTGLSAARTVSGAAIDLVSTAKTPNAMASNGAIFKAAEATVNNTAGTVAPQSPIIIQIPLEGKIIAEVIYDPIKGVAFQRGDVAFA